MDKKKIIIIVSSAAVLLAAMIIIMFLIKKNRESVPTDGNAVKIFTPDFLSVDEKTKLGIPEEIKIQAMTRNENGEVTVYKIIKNDSDIINPAEVKPISPRDLNR